MLCGAEGREREESVQFSLGETVHRIGTYLRPDAARPPCSDRAGLGVRLGALSGHIRHKAGRTTVP